VYTVLFCTSFLFHSCTSAHKIDVDLTIEELKQRVNENSSKITSLKAEGSIDIDTPELSNTGTITVNILKPDSLYTKLEGPFGIDVADILLTRESFIYYNVMDNRVIKGPSTPLNIGAIMRIKLDFDFIINGFSGTFFFNNISSDNSELKTEENKYLLITKDDSNKEIKMYWIDPDDFYITKYIITDYNKKVLLEMEYLDYNYRDGVHFPNRIAISKPQDNQYIWLDYMIKSFNSKDLTFKFKIPGSAKVIYWDD
jgi:outer membrane lipoprotein-sorting protein